MRAGGIIRLLEFFEAAFSNNLARVTADLEAAIAAYESVTVTEKDESEKITYEHGRSKYFGLQSRFRQGRTGKVYSHYY